MIDTVTGGQFGSEGKGLIVGHIADRYNVHVRVGAANAGHTVYTQQADPASMDHRNATPLMKWEKHVLQQLPCAAYANPKAELVLGPGALISPGILHEEIEANVIWRREHGYTGLRLYVDPHAHVVTADHIRKEAATDLAERIGSTSTIAREGIGTATAARVLREAECVTALDYFRMRSVDEAWKTFATLLDSGQIINDPANHVLLEGTQGTGLSITTGRFPYCTSRNTTAPGLIADCGADLRLVRNRIVVFRSFPIRVAGNSGPFYADSKEIDWRSLGVDSEKERTTVTKKVRRVATFSFDQLRDAVKLNGATSLALTFADYVDPEVYGQGSLSADATDWATQIGRTTGVPVHFVGTGPHSVVPIRHLLPLL